MDLKKRGVGRGAAPNKMIRTAFPCRKHGDDFLNGMAVLKKAGGGWGLASPPEICKQNDPHNLTLRSPTPTCAIASRSKEFGGGGA